MALTRYFAKGEVFYCGPDHSTRLGATALANRLTRYWAGKGESRKFEIFPVREGSDTSFGAVYGVRQIKEIPPVAPAQVAPEMVVGETPRQKIKAVILKVLAESFPDVTYDEVMNKHVASRRIGKRPLRESGARRYCINAVAEAYKEINPAEPKISFPHLGRIFNVDHTTVMCASDADFRYRHGKNVLARHHARKALQVAA